MILDPIRKCAGAVLAVCACLLAAAEQPEPRTAAPGSVYVKMDYMKLTDATPREYLEVELGEWRAIQEQRFRQGVTTAWYFYEMMPGARKDDDQPYDYITVSVFDDYDKVFDDAGTEAIFQVYPGIELQDLYDRADAARSFVRSDLWKLTGVTAPDAESKPMGPYLIITYYDALNDISEIIEIESGFWAPIHETRIRRGHLKSAAHLVVSNPADEARNYSFSTVEYFDTLSQLRVPIDTELLTAAHPEMTGQELEQQRDRTDEARTEYKSQLWRLIDYIDATTLADE